MSSREPVRRVRLGTILALLLLFTIVPLVLFAGWLVYKSWQQQQDLVNSQNVERARAVSVAVDQEVQSTITALEALATLGPIESDNLQAFHDVASRMLSLELGWQAVRLVDLDSRVVVNTALPFGERSTLVSDDWVRAIRDDQAPGGLGGTARSGRRSSTSCPSACRWCSAGAFATRSAPASSRASSAPSCTGNCRRTTASSP